MSDTESVFLKVVSSTAIRVSFDKINIVSLEPNNIYEVPVSLATSLMKTKSVERASPAEIKKLVDDVLDSNKKTSETPLPADGAGVTVSSTSEKPSDGGNPSVKGVTTGGDTPVRKFKREGDKS
jgi:hypothetical protein